MLDLIERGVAQPDSLTNLHAQLGKLSKTLGMVGLNSAGTALQTQLPTVAAWAASGVADSPPALLRLADAVLYVESMVGNLERGERRITRPTPAEPAGSRCVRRAPVGRGAHRGDRGGQGRPGPGQACDHRVPGIQWRQAQPGQRPGQPAGGPGRPLVLGQERAALLVGGCADYIQQRMIETAQMPSEQMLETLADALTSLEYYLEGGAVLRPQGQPDVLDLASASVKALAAGGRLMAGESRWQAGRPTTAQVGGWVLAHCQQRFLQDDNGLLFPANG